MNEPLVAPPEHWTTDVVLTDGGTAHVRPIRPDDAPELIEFHRRLSPESIYLRFFSPTPKLSPAMAERFSTVDHVDRVALVAELQGRLVAVARYDRCPDPAEAEVAFVVADEQQRRGLGTVLLEHLAAAARERGISRFVADTLPTNQSMLGVFQAAGFAEHSRLDEGVVRVEMLIEPTDETRRVVEGREHRAEAASIARLFNPRSVAVVGASRDRSSVGYQVLRNLLAGGFDGPVYPVNPSATHVGSVKAYPTVEDIDGPVDLAVIAVPAEAVLTVVRSCATKGVVGLVVLSAGFGEVSPEGQALQDELRDLARSNGMRVVGPNCIGLANTAIGLNATFVNRPPTRGRVAVQSQSGAVGIAILDDTSRLGIGVSTFVSVGNKADISGNDLLQYWEDDPDTSVVLLYLESFGNPRKFARIARRVSRRKPVVAVKSGRTSAGVRAASSHTAALASPDLAVDALFEQTGVIRVDTIDELLDMARVLATQPLPAGRRVAIVGNSGGPGILAADACEAAGLELAELSEDTKAALRRVLDRNASVTNPVDLIAAADSATYRRALDLIVADAAVDAVLVICTPTFAANPADVAAAIGATPDDGGTPIIACFVAWDEMPALLGAADHQIPSFPSPEPAARALGRAATYASWRRQPPGRVDDLPSFDADAVREAGAQLAADTGEGAWLTAEQTEHLLGAAGIPLAASAHVTEPEAAAQAAVGLGFPVALKASGPGIVHKSDVGGVRLALEDRDAVAAAYRAMRDAIGPDMTGAIVQAMAPPGVETIVGVVQDRSFGPLVMFGLGGIATELLGDRTFRILPVTDLDAAAMVRSLRASPLLFGYRGSAPVDAGALEDLLARTGRLAGLLPELAELDLNPVIAGPEGVVVVDARVRLAVAPITASPDLRHLS